MTYYRRYTPWFFFSGIALFVILAVVAVSGYAPTVASTFTTFAIIAVVLTMIRDDIWLDSVQRKIVFTQGFRFFSKPHIYSFDQLIRLRLERIVQPNRYVDTVKYQLYADLDPSSIFGTLLIESQDKKSLIADAKHIAELANCPLVEGISLQEIRNELGPPL